MIDQIIPPENKNRMVVYHNGIGHALNVETRFQIIVNSRKYKFDKLMSRYGMESCTEDMCAVLSVIKQTLHSQ